MAKGNLQNDSPQSTKHIFDDVLEWKPSVRALVHVELSVFSNFCFDFLLSLQGHQLVQLAFPKDKSNRWVVEDRPINITPLGLLRQAEPCVLHGIMAKVVMSPQTTGVPRAHVIFAPILLQVFQLRLTAILGRRLLSKAF